MNAQATQLTTLPFDVERVRADFPILQKMAGDKPIVYFDNAATSQKPSAVLDRLIQYYTLENANVHRGVHTLSQIATDAFESARETAASFLGAASSREIIYTRGTTEAINMVAQCWAEPRLKSGDEIVITALEHHSNIVPWQMVCEKTGAQLKVVDIESNGEVLLEKFIASLSERTKMVSVAHASNALGTINPVKAMVEAAKQVDATVLLDGAQAAPHMPIDVQALDCDFYAFSGHKVFGPTGIGVLYGKEAVLDAMTPYQYGGEMIERVTFEKSTFNTLPYKFEAGTPNIAGAIGLAAAIDYLNALDQNGLHLHESNLLKHAHELARNVDGLRIIGEAPNKVSVLSFVLDGIHPHDVGELLDQQGIYVRTGHHCTMPLMQCLGIPGTVRASFAFYNTLEEIDRLFQGIERVKTFF